jgi:tetratricopeptide (TPR) repeat protein
VPHRDNSLLSLKQYTKAIQDFSRALEIDPTHSKAKSSFIKAKTIQGQIQSELESARRGEFLMSSSKDFIETQPNVDSLIDSVFRETKIEDKVDKKHKKKSKKKHSKKKEKKQKRPRKDEGYDSSSSNEIPL